MSLSVIAPGPSTLLQDDGRPGLAAQGVGAAGAFDRRALEQLRALLGDVGDAGPGTAVLEVLGGGLVVEAIDTHLVAVTGAFGVLRIDEEPVAHGSLLLLRAGQRLSLAPFTRGLRGYVGVAGGLCAAPVLGSRSTDTLGRLGPAPLAAGDVLPAPASVLGSQQSAPGSKQSGEQAPPDPLGRGSTCVEVLFGPREDWFTEAALETLLSAAWTVSPRSDRIGVRLDGPALTRAIKGELASEPCVRGSVQVTSAGQPVVLGPDHPVTGGYPVIAVVAEGDVDRLAQVRPGETVRFRRRAVAE